MPERDLFVTPSSCPLRRMEETRIDEPPDAQFSNSPVPMTGRRVAWVCLVVVLTGLGMWTLREFLPALVWAGVLAIAFWPSFHRARLRWPLGRHNILLPAAFTLLIAVVFVLPMVLTGLQAGREARTALVWIDTARHDGIPVPDFVSHLPVFSNRVSAWWQANLSDPAAASELLSRLRKPEYVEAGQQVGLAILHRLVIFGFCLLTVFFLFKDGDAVAEQLRRGSARMFGPVGERIGRQIIASIHGTVNGLVLVGLAEGLLLYVIYLFLGVPRPALFGVATAIGAMIPFGAPVVFGLAALLLVAQGAMGQAVAIVVAGSVISFVADHFVRPVLIGGATRLPFVWVLFGILGGVTTWGLLGLFLGPAIMAALILLWREWTETV